MFNNSPYKEIPEELVKEYTLNNTIPVIDWYIDNSAKNINIIWTDDYINSFLKNFTLDNIFNNRHGIEPYPNASLMLAKAFKLYNITNKNVAVIGSITPWIEAILLNLNNTVTTVEYNVPQLENITNLKSISYWDFQKTENLYDCIISYSSIEHSGLGRYGDPLDPNGDIKTMDDIHKNLINDGLLIWGAPVGHDAVVWNAHRIYGKIRLPIIFKNFIELEWIDHNKDNLLNMPLMNNSVNPVIVLKKI